MAPSKNKPGSREHYKGLISLSPFLPKNAIRQSGISQVRALNELEGKTSSWYNTNLANTERAEIILKRISQQLNRNWMTRDLDEFVYKMTRISWINTLYDQRPNILAADTELNDKYLSSKKEDLSFGREKDYEICAIQSLATILDGIEERNAETQSRPHVQHYRMKLTGQLSRSRLITNPRGFPNWVLCPDILHVYLQENAIDPSGDDAQWQRYVTYSTRDSQKDSAP
ncbi:hypothetical protein F5Y01DRAFT_320618 [Xylaria sp. FL0043]|nr:hypothetical protein F5Y01DRAFT_320618 [Xylaria sp. FL0043]